MSEIVWTVVGVALIAFGLLDVFHTLMHHGGTGYLSPWVFSAVWRLSKATGHRLGTAVGPAAMVLVILMWVFLQGIGWAMVYYPHVPGGFSYSAGVDPHTYPAIAEALYFSLVTLATLGFGDMVATSSWIRWASPLQALTGFALLTAALTWFTQVYPPLLRRRALALELSRLAQVDYAGQIPTLSGVAVCTQLTTLTDKIEAVRIDFFQHSEGFYFREQPADLSLARQLPYAVRLAGPEPVSSDSAVQLSLRQLSVALDRLADTLDGTFLHSGGSAAEVLAAYALDHHPDPSRQR